MSETAPDADAPLPLVRRYFPELPDDVLERLQKLAVCVVEWNAKLNLISRKDVANLEERHIVHSLAIEKVWKPERRARILDLGTGGGFPGLPLAILHPKNRFTLVDSVAKKARAVEDVVAALELKNVAVVNDRAENLRKKSFDYVLGRAVAPLPRFLEWALPLIQKRNAGAPANGAFYFKGTRYRDELAESPHQPADVWSLDDWFAGEFFEEKFLLHFPR